MADNKQYITQIQENGAVQISEEVIVSIVTVAAREVEGVAGFYTRPGNDIVDMMNIKSRGKSGIRVTITDEDKLYVTCNLIVNFGAAVVNVAKAVQENITAAIESMAGITAVEVNVNICGISVEQK